MDVALIYVEHKNAADEILYIKDKLYKYLVKIRRHKVDDQIVLRNSENIKIAYIYEILEILPHSMKLKLIDYTIKEIKSAKYLHVGWCIVDTKIIEKVMPMLNELGVAKITFIYCDRSQKNIKPDFNRLSRILQSSSSQCGRTNIMEFEIIKNIYEFIQKYPKCVVFDFCDNILKSHEVFDTILVGCEGGFTKDERLFLAKQKIYKLDTPMILRSQTAVVSIASKMLL